GRAVLVFLGRTHYYERRDVAAVAHAVRVAAASGCRAVVLTNACGAIRPTLQPGQIVVMSDHVNMTGASPLEGGEFVDLSDLYSARLRAACRSIDPTLAEGVYVGYWGPNYETPAEIRAYRTLGGDLVGMSTVLEAIAARAAGLEVLGLSLVTNMAAGIAGPLSHDEVLEQGRAGAQPAGALPPPIVHALLRCPAWDPLSLTRTDSDSLTLTRDRRPPFMSRISTVDRGFPRRERVKGPDVPRCPGGAQSGAGASR